MTNKPRISAPLSIRLTDAERKVAEQAAHARGLPLSTFARNALLVASQEPLLPGLGTMSNAYNFDASEVSESRLESLSQSRIRLDAWGVPKEGNK